MFKTKRFLLEQLAVLPGHDVVGIQNPANNFNLTGSAFTGFQSRLPGVPRERAGGCGNGRGAMP